MKRLLVLLGLSVASVASAASVGGALTFGGINAEYRHNLDSTSAIRGTLDVGYFGSFGASASYMKSLNQVNPQTNLYVAGGLGINTLGGVWLLRPNLLAGVNYQLNSDFSVYGELGAGYMTLIAKGGENTNLHLPVGVAPDLRIGVTYNLAK